ncbi:synaptic plasticity regulator PANTS isoform X1 [Megalopta genalis]|uniref:synaptic plasticity regulator PANTS isoform X1 n=1 Tax=Megalopta genalis TaxID=115081 RepID=UPI003FD5CCC0
MPETNRTSEPILAEMKDKSGDENVKSDKERDSADVETNKSNEEIKEHELEWMIKPCQIYNEEYRDCKSIKARFHQYFVFGDTIDCTQWKTDYNNCYIWEKYKSERAYAKLIDSEKNRRMERLHGHYSNDVWERRDKPPENWNAPLPEWLQQKVETSYLANVDKIEEQYSKLRTCTIS